jgi:enoyl-CoA hydratase
MTYKNIIFEKDGAIAVIKFNRPKVMNAVNSQTMAEFSDAVEKVEQDNAIRCLIITGEGDKAFVAGADISEMANLGPLDLRAYSLKGHELLFRLEKLPIPVIACVNGYALGGGSEFALACDFIYASDNAKFGQPEITLGLIPGWGGTQRFSRLVGKALAKEFCLTGDLISAQEAKEMGMVNKVFSQESLWKETMKTAKKMATMGRVSTKAIKQCVDKGSDVDLRTACHMEADAFGYCVATPDGKEGMSAFLEKRKPEFKGELA